MSKLLSYALTTGGEYTLSDFKSFCDDQGILQTMGPPNCPELNGAAESWNRTIKEKIRCSLIESGLPSSFWPYALSYCTKSYNHLPTRTNSKFTSPISLSGIPECRPVDFHSFGCEVWYHIPNTTSKLDSRAHHGVFVSYLKNNLGFYIFDLTKKCLVKATLAKFFDSDFPGLPLDHSSSSSAPTEARVPWPDLESPLPAHSLPVVLPPSDIPVPTRRPHSSRVRRPPDRYSEYGATAMIMSESDLKSYKQATKSQNWDQWKRAAVSEFESLVGKETWRLVPRPARCRIIRCKWVFKTKRNVDKSVDKLKACLVALGFSQIKGIDFHKVFSPTSCQESLRILVAIMAHKNWKA